MTTDTREMDELAYREAVALANALWNRHYREKAPNWKALPDLRGVLSQIDNMAAGMSQMIDALSLTPTDTRGLPSFETEWAKKEAAGYIYGGDALENVRFGYEIATEALATLTPPPHDPEEGAPHVS